MTKHSIERAHERAKLGKNAAVSFISRAKQHGIGAEMFPAKERKYMQCAARDGSRVIYYSNYLFVLIDELCITVYPAPPWFMKSYSHDGKTQVKNAKKYFKKYPLEDKQFNGAFCIQ